MNPKKPIRRKQKFVSRTDPETGKVVAFPVTEEHHRLGDQGDLESVEIEHQSFDGCGCPTSKPVGGRCHLCHSVSCEECSGRCFVCKMPLCLSCSQWLEIDGERVRLCRRCKDDYQRKAVRRGVARALLRPFISFEKGE